MKLCYLESPSTDPRFNLALEQYVFDRMDRAKEYLMLWQNSNAVIVGKNQNTAAEIDAEFVAAHDICVVRRLSGGGAVYHDLGNLNFTFVADSHDCTSMDIHRFCRIIADALATLHISAEVNGRNDITINGRKFSGNSQYLRGGRVMHHGTILFSSNLEMVAGALHASTAKLRSNGVQSVRSRVANLCEYLPPGVTLDAFKRALLEAIFEGSPPSPYQFSAAELAAIREIRQTRYARWDWNYGFSPACAVQRERYFDGCGTVRLNMEVSDGCICALTLHGDFFGNGAISDVTDALLGCPAREAALLEALREIDVSGYLNGLTAGQLANFLSE